ncbi:hypothetical protein G4B88_000799 [Cannabis sativa]|uniref:Ubiquitin-like protease family profile domain-containing protein n=1 Tax=Cannabis sativa TaxID=3483 RepID=A0A7J6I3X0_CANSA|nr:hypothetical protein G4B88_000799 [Cannabis sativa]
MHGITEKVTVRDVASIFFSDALKDDEDYVKIALVYFFFGYLYGYPQGKKIDNFIFAMVDEDDYIEVLNRFGWGKLLWEKTFYHLKIALKDGNDTFEQLAKKRKIEKGYKLKGFHIAFLIWLYEIISSLSPRFCKRIGNKSPRVLNWKNNPTSEFSELIQNVFNNPKIVIKDFVALRGEKSQSLFSKFKFDPQYIPKRFGDVVCSDEVNDEVKCQQQIKDEISSLRIEFLGQFSKLGEILNGLKKKIDGHSKDSEFFSSPDISDDGGGLQLSVHTGQAETDDVSFHDDSDKLSLVLYDESYLSPEIQKSVKKYSDADNLLSPPMDFSFIEISEKMWFYQLYDCGEFLKKIKQDDTLNQRVTTTDYLFDQVIWNFYNQFLKSGSDPSKIDFENVISRYIVGEYLFCNNPCVLTDHVLVYVNIQKQKHWILVHFDIKERMLNVYNSMYGAVNKKRALDHVKAYSTMLSFYLEYLDVYSSRPDLNLVEGPYSVGKRELLNFKFIDGLPSQVNSDCVVFVIKFADLFILRKIDDIPSKMSYLVKKTKDNENDKAKASQLVFLILVATLSVPGSQASLSGFCWAMTWNLVSSTVVIQSGDSLTAFCVFLMELLCFSGADLVLLLLSVSELVNYRLPEFFRWANVESEEELVHCNLLEKRECESEKREMRIGE